MRRILSVRIGEKARRAVARRARASGRSESAIVRDAVEAYLGDETGEAPYAALRDLIGIVAEGPAGLLRPKRRQGAQAAARAPRRPHVILIDTGPIARSCAGRTSTTSTASQR